MRLQIAKLNFSSKLQANPELADLLLILQRGSTN